MDSISIEALLWGIFSAISLPLGAFVGFWLKPKQKVNSAFMAFGAGALLFALTIELFSSSLHHAEDHGNIVIYATVIGAILGGLLFDILNQFLNHRGAFLRSLSNTKKYIQNLKVISAKKAIQKLGKVDIFQQLNPQQLSELFLSLEKKHFSKGTNIFNQGDSANSLYFIIEGSVDINKDNKTIATLKDSDTFGEISLITSLPRSASALAKTDCKVFKMSSEKFHELISMSSKVKDEVLQLVSDRLKELSNNHDYKISNTKDLNNWLNTCMEHINSSSIIVSNKEVDEHRKNTPPHSGAAMAIWLGILIDAIPESLVIGMLATSTKGISLALITGVFLANFPEAMSSSVGMEKSGLSKKRIYLMWLSITAITGIGAFLGAVLFPAEAQGNNLIFISGIEGLAAGAMLTAIAESMLPEAYENGGAIVGFSTLMGFITALLVKII